MSEILSRTVFETCLADQSEAPWEEEVRMLLAHDAALRAEVERLRKALREIETRTGHFGEAPPPPEWMPMLSLIAWIGRTARAAIAAEEGK